MFNSYQEYLLSPTWKTLREKAIIRARGRCQLCNHHETLNVHHRKYPKEWGKEPLSDLTVLCEKCHNNFHDTIKPRELPIENMIEIQPNRRVKLPLWQKEIIKRQLKEKIQYARLNSNPR
jgi:hypothetical protein